ncbi:MAG: MBL fold metallo-hydrolase [Bacteroidetes bacterium]|nr:MBL fold metallo-hydrolase [Bacteroidota bacterium]
MSLFITSLNSGSNGNCYYVGNDKEAVLIDAGISCRETEKRMKRLGLAIESVKAIFISHEHSDHIKGVEVLSKKFKLPVYITNATLNNSQLNIGVQYIRTFRGYENIIVGDLTVKPFPKLHDAADPYSFIVSGNGINIGVLTDIGNACHHVIENFKNCHAAFLEANYDEELLETGGYPFYLKKRIRGGHGHLSNVQALEIFTKHRSENLSHLLLSHLSRENNSPQLVQKLFLEHCGNTKIVVATRDYETEIYHITGSSKIIEPVIKQAAIVQTSLF